MDQTYWWKEAKIYELYVDRFAGDFVQLTGKLDYFSKLGINCLHILPHYPSPMIDQGYDISDYRSVRAELGTIDDFRAFVDAAHGRGIRIIADFVLNHISTAHPWFVDARSSKQSPLRDYFLWSATGEEYALAPNMLPDLKKSNWIENPETAESYFATFYPEQADLNWSNPAVFEAMMENMDFWAALGVDGFRLDAAPFLVKVDGTTCTGLPETHALIKRIRAHLEEKFERDIVLLGEVGLGGEDDIVTSIKNYFGEGDECHLMYHFPLMAEFWIALQSGNRAGVDEMVRRSYDIPENCAWATFLRNHDEIELRFISSQETRGTLLSFLDLEGDYLFNKGQSTAKRNASILGDAARIMEAFGLLYGTPGSPIMYYGDEIGMKNLPLNTDIVDMRQYVRGTFDWTEAKRQMTDPHSLFSQVAALIKSLDAKPDVGAPPQAML
jgi:maltose alpha-D-glucosyltransferase/alpha-amylase